jgi:hypothetical protein
MPAYAGINQPVPQAVPGHPTYLLGTFDYRAATGNYVITNVARTAFTCTVTVAVKEGNVPIVGQLVSVLCSDSSFNVTQAALIAPVSVDATTGIGTITYTGTTFGEVVSIAATGQVIGLVLEVGETLVNITSMPVCLQSNTGANNGRDVTFEVTLSGGTPTATVAVQKAINNVGTEFVDAGAGANLNFTAAAGTKQYTAIDFRDHFVRFVISGVSGGSSPKIVAKVLC